MVTCLERFLFLFISLRFLTIPLFLLYMSEDFSARSLRYHLVANGTQAESYDLGVR